ncbi:MAG TPA: FAD binding domain-containing protein [Candidatus Acidoferrales bacterium]|nr:FAD binding domain-containing protein [Candidatus Acidoferrales bacterium]
MIAAPFRVARPRSIEGAVRLLSDHGPQAMLIAGGTDLLPNLQMRLFSPGLLVDLKSVRQLSGVEYSREGGLRVGSTTTLSRLLEFPAIHSEFPVLAAAVRVVAGPLQRNMGTLGGNLCLETRCRWYNQSHFWRTALGGCLKKDGNICHVAPGGKFCWAAWSGDAAPALLALDAEIEIVGARGARRIPLREFYKNDGMDRIALARDEILTAIHVPPRMAGWTGTYRKLRVRDSIDYPLAGVAVALQLDAHGICRDARAALSAVNPAPRLVPEANESLAGERFSIELVERIAHAAIRTAKPLTTSASTPEYRREMVKLFTRRALEDAWRESPNSVQ